MRHPYFGPLPPGYGVGGTLMRQMWPILQGNAYRTWVNRMQRNQLALGAQALKYGQQARMTDIASRNRLIEGLFGALRGGGQPAGRSPAGGAPLGLGSAAPQEAAAGRLYGAALAGAAPAALYQGGFRGMQFQGPGGMFGGATLPTAPWLGAGAGGAELGIDVAPGRVWGPQHAADARARLGAVGQATLPYLQGGGARRNVGLANLFQDYLRGATARTYSGLERAGTKAEAGHQLRSHLTRSRLQNALWDLISQMYGSQLGSGADQRLLNVRMLQALA